ncbi:MAG: hypothetical protein AVDCRST_MAG04-3226, partial [uncultured Acetobacteraceae bacterium]
WGRHLGSGPTWRAPPGCGRWRGGSGARGRRRGCWRSPAPWRGRAAPKPHGWRAWSG